MFCVVLVRPSLAPWMLWSWACWPHTLLVSPSVLPSPQSGELTQSLGRKLHSCSLHILSNLLSKHRSTECAPWGTGFWNSKAEHPFFFSQLSLGPSFPEAVNTEGPKDWMGKGGWRASKMHWVQQTVIYISKLPSQLVLRMWVLSLVEWNWWGHRKKWEWCLEGKSWL